MAGRDGRGRGARGRVRAARASGRSRGAGRTCSASSTGPASTRAIACEDFVLTTPDDTRQAARDLLAAGVDLILFAGGDGTARNICAAVGDAVPVIGVPAGVKIHSARVRHHPGRRRRPGCLYLHERPAAVRLREGEVMDIDEEAFRRGPRLRPALRLHDGPLRARSDAERQGRRRGRRGARPQRHRHRGRSPTWRPGCSTSSARARPRAPSWSASACPRRCSASTPSATARSPAPTSPRATCCELVDGRARDLHRRHRHRRPGAHLRARQPADQPRRHPRASAAATSSSSPPRPSSSSLEGRPLLVDTGDPALDEQLSGYVKVVTALGERTMYKVGGSSRSRPHRTLVLDGFKPSTPVPRIGCGMLA